MLLFIIAKPFLCPIEPSSPRLPREIHDSDSAAYFTGAYLSAGIMAGFAGGPSGCSTGIKYTAYLTYFVKCVGPTPFLSLNIEMSQEQTCPHLFHWGLPFNGCLLTYNLFPLFTKLIQKQRYYYVKK